MRLTLTRRSGRRLSFQKRGISSWNLDVRTQPRPSSRYGLGRGQDQSATLPLLAIAPAIRGRSTVRSPARADTCQEGQSNPNRDNSQENPERKAVDRNIRNIAHHRGIRLKAVVSMMTDQLDIGEALTTTTNKNTAQARCTGAIVSCTHIPSGQKIGTALATEIEEETTITATADAGGRAHAAETTAARSPLNATVRAVIA